LAAVSPISRPVRSILRCPRGDTGKHCFYPPPDRFSVHPPACLSVFLPLSAPRSLFYQRTAGSFPPSFLKPAVKAFLFLRRFFFSPFPRHGFLFLMQPRQIFFFPFPENAVLFLLSGVRRLLASHPSFSSVPSFFRAAVLFLLGFSRRQFPLELPFLPLDLGLPAIVPHRFLLPLLSFLQGFKLRISLLSCIYVSPWSPVACPSSYFLSKN